VKTATKTALRQVHNLGLVPKLIATQTKSGLGRDMVTYPANCGTPRLLVPDAGRQAVAKCSRRQCRPRHEIPTKSKELVQWPLRHTQAADRPGG
jgi:hypothetical protein